VRTPIRAHVGDGHSLGRGGSAWAEISKPAGSQLPRRWIPRRRVGWRRRVGLLGGGIAAGAILSGLLVAPYYYGAPYTIRLPATTTTAAAI
jgi:hypothetical protein